MPDFSLVQATICETIHTLNNAVILRSPIGEYNERTYFTGF